MTTIPPSTSGWTLQNINSKVRSITGTPSIDQLTDAQVNAYINNYLLYVMPQELKVQIANQNIMFKTIPGVNVYSFPAAFLTDSPGAYADGFPLIFYEDPDIFYQDWPIQFNVDNVSSGDGITTAFNGTTQGFPIIVGTYFITDGYQVLQDNGLGVLVDQTVPLPLGGFGTINYLTGAFTSTFGVPPALGNTIYDKYQAYQGNRPQGVLFYNNNFTFMPVPDQAYQVQLQGFIAPVSLTAGSTPLQAEWGPLIAYGASLEIFSDRGDTDNYDKFYPMLKRYENVALGRTIQQYTPMQGVPRF